MRILRILAFKSAFAAFAFLCLSAAMVSQNGSADFSGITSDERQSIESVCLYDKMMVGPAAYNSCIQKHLSALRAAGSPKPDLSALNTDERQSIEAVCLYDKMTVGPVAYNGCIGRQIRLLQASPYRKVDLSGVSFDEQQSIQSVCLYEKMTVGPAAYDACLAKQVNALRLTKQPTASPQGEISAQHSLSNVQATASDLGIKRLSYFIGTWNLEAFMTASPFGPAGKMTGTHRNEWAPDNLSVILHWDEQRPSGRDTGDGKYLYDSISKVYIYTGATSSGEKESSIGTVSGNTWTWTSNPLLPSGQAVKGRFQITETSATIYSLEFDIATQSGDWTTVMVGQATKAK